jgi:hypothetical protein
MEKFPVLKQSDTYVKEYLYQKVPIYQVIVISANTANTANTASIASIASIANESRKRKRGNTF